jgi:hypothetical protein
MKIYKVSEFRKVLLLAFLVSCQNLFAQLPTLKKIETLKFTEIIRNQVTLQPRAFESMESAYIYCLLFCLGLAPSSKLKDRQKIALTFKLPLKSLLTMKAIIQGGLSP